MTPDLKDKKFVISTHVYTTGPAQDLKEYLISKKIGRLFFIGHPLFYDKKLDGSGFEKYEDGKLIEKNYAKIRKTPEVISYFDHIFKSIKWVRKTRLKWDLFVGSDNLNALAGIVLRKFGRVKKVVYYVIDYNPKRFANPVMNWVYHKVDQFCVKHSDETWNLSGRMKTARKKYFGFDEGSQIEVPIGIWFKRYKVAKKSETPTLAFMGHVLKKQGVQHIIKAIPKIAKKVKKFKFLIIGGGNYIDALKELSKDLGVESYVEFTGFIESHKDVEKKLSTASAASVIYEKYDEKGDLSFTYFADPGKLKSYMASGLPIILTDVPHNAKEIEKKGCGKIVNTDPKNIASAVIDLMSDNKKLAQFQKNAREYARDYDWNAIFSENIERVLYERDEKQNVIKKIKTFFLLRPNILGRAPIKLIKIVNRWWRSLPFMRSYVFNKEKQFIPAGEPIDVIIPTIDREIDVLPHVIKAIRENVKHPIKAFKIVAPRSKKIVEVCKKNKCQFIDEDGILPIKKSDFSFMLNGEERSGWIFQQFIKLSENLSSSEHYLVVDSDTVLLRPQVLMRNGKTLLLTNDEYYPTYGKIYKLLFGYSMGIGIRYFNSHQMLFTRKYVREFQKEIKKHTGLTWHKAIIENTNYEGRSVFADYLSYAAWMLKNHPDECVVEYWYNLDSTRKELSGLRKNKKDLSKKYKSISFHHYNSK